MWSVTPEHIDEVDAEDVISCRLNGPAVICHRLINSGSKKQQSWSLLTLRLEHRKRTYGFIQLQPAYKTTLQYALDTYYILLVFTMLRLILIYYR